MIDVIRGVIRRGAMDVRYRCGRLSQVRGAVVQRIDDTVWLRRCIDKGAFPTGATFANGMASCEFDHVVAHEEGTARNGRFKSVGIRFVRGETCTKGERVVMRSHV